MNIIKRVYSNNSHHKVKNFFCSFNFVSACVECSLNLSLQSFNVVGESNHYAVNLNLYTNICQLYFNKTTRKNKMYN